MDILDAQDSPGKHPRNLNYKDGLMPPDQMWLAAAALCDALFNAYSITNFYVGTRGLDVDYLGSVVVCII